MQWFVYIAQAKTGKYYTGITHNPEERIIKHNSGHGSQMARQQGPFVLVYISSPYLNKSQARVREIQIKKWSVNKKKKLISGEWK
jgi:putative endonuclease